MRGSHDRIITSHVGSLPRPDDLIEANRKRDEGKSSDEQAFQALLQTAVNNVVRHEKEVGVDVPNATIMVVDHAERFGLAQLHQLRGRVGRGAAKSYCILMTGKRVSEQAEERLAAMVRTQNGFELAELDLAMRGPGEFFGTRQAGLPGFRVANLVRDRDLLELAKQEATRFAAAPDDSVTKAERDRVWDHLRQAWQRRYGLMEAG